MSTETQISPDAHEAAHVALQIKVRDGRPSYVLYGALEVASLDEARELLFDRRETPRHAPIPLQASSTGGNNVPSCRGVLDAFPWEHKRG